MGMQQFNPAPGPPPGKGRGGGGRQVAGGGGMLPMHDYGGAPFMVNPFMMQHPFMHAAAAQGGPWNTGLMAAAQQGAWYGAPMGGRPGMQMGMAPHYAAFGPAGYYPMRGPGAPGASCPARARVHIAGAQPV